MRQSTPTLRDRHAAATRDTILNAAMAILGSGPEGDFSHESIAKAAGVGARTVYRYFPDRASLLEALWIRLRAATNTRFPTSEEDIVPFVRRLFGEFEKNQKLVRAVLTSPAGTAVRERGGAEGRPAFAASLAALLADLPGPERACVTAVFVAVYSAPFWQLLRDRGGLSATEAQDAAAWALSALLHVLRTNKAGGPKRNRKTL